ncbi:MAG: hypothetical protein WKH64_12965 [Chloroflexia bacterium]
MKRPQGGYKCTDCGRRFGASLLRSNQWGDSCCPECRSPNVAPVRSRLAGFISAYYLYSVY